MMIYGAPHMLSACRRMLNWRSDTSHWIGLSRCLERRELCANGPPVLGRGRGSLCRGSRGERAAPGLDQPMRRLSGRLVGQLAAAGLGLGRRDAQPVDLTESERHQTQRRGHRLRRRPSPAPLGAVEGESIGDVDARPAVGVDPSFDQQIAHRSDVPSTLPRHVVDTDPSTQGRDSFNQLSSCSLKLQGSHRNGVRVLATGAPARLVIFPGGKIHMKRTTKGLGCGSDRSGRCRRLRASRRHSVFSGRCRAAAAPDLLLRCGHGFDSPLGCRQRPHARCACLRPSGGMAVDLLVVAGGCFTFETVEFLAANLLEAEFERFEYSSAPLELILREAGPAGECAQGCGHSPTGR